MTIATTAWTPAAGNADDHDYNAYLARFNAGFLQAVSNGSEQVFMTDASGLYAAYLDSFVDGTERQHHTCHACRHFIERFGGLVTIDSTGRTTSAIWRVEDSPPHYRAAVEAMARIVRRAQVTGVFRSRDRTWGTPKTGPWRHLSVTPPAALIMRAGFDTPHQAMAMKQAEFDVVSRALTEYSLEAVETALTLLRTESLYRSEKVIGPANWLRDLHVACNAAHPSNRSNVIWREVSSAPAGFGHVRSSMIGTLLDDIVAGLPFADVAARFAAKMSPTQYQRPQAPPTAGNIAQAERLISLYAASGSLQRRFLRPDEVVAIWKPRDSESAAPAGVFGHLHPKAQSAPRAVDVPSVTVTWEKFVRTVLPTAERIEFYAANRPDSYCGLVTAANPESPPILQWDSEESRNPVSWYLWTSGSLPQHFGLGANQYHDVTAVARKPCFWGANPERFAHQGDGVIFVIAGARETRNAGNALFPEILKSDFHSIRATLEAYSRGQEIAGINEPHACGLLLNAGRFDAQFRVTSGGQTVTYRLDRWD